MDFRDRYILETSGSKGLDELTRSTVALAQAGERAAGGGLKAFSGGIVQGTRALQDFQAAGIAGITNNIIEIGARFGPVGVAIGAVGTVAALSADKIGDAFENLASRPGFDRLVSRFEWIGEVATGAFSAAAAGVDAFLDAVLGADVEQAKTKLSDYEQGLKRVELQLAANKQSQDALTRSGELDAEQIRELNRLRDEQIGLMEHQAQLQDRERIRKEYGDRASDEQIKSGESFKAATKGDAGSRLFDALSRRMSEADAARVIRSLERGSVGSETLWAALGAGGGGVADVIRDFELRTQGTNLKDAQKLQQFSDQAMTALRAGPFLRGAGVGLIAPGDSPVQNWSAPRPPKPAPILDAPEWGTQDFGAQAGVATPKGRQAGPLGQIGGATVPIDAMADQAFGPSPAGAAKARRDQIDRLRDRIGSAQANVDAADRAALAELEAAADALLRSAGSNERKQQVVLHFAQAVAAAIQGTEFSEQRLRSDLTRMQAKLRSRPGGPAFGTVGGFGGL